jgi:nucleotide-binding universal stress UspA family protein
MYKKILLCTDGSPYAEVATDYAIWLARKLPAHLLALYVTDIRLLEGPLLADFSGAVGAQPYSALLPQLQEIERERAEAILAAVAKRCADKAVKHEVFHETGMLVQEMLKYEQRADLVVVGQRGEHARWAHEGLGSSVERLARASIKPCLVVTERFREPRRILLAYDGSEESNKALRAGIELAENLGAALALVTVCQRETEESASKVLRQAKELATNRKLTVESQLRHGDAEAEILAECDKINADLIIMGAYGHTRIRELILGSTTTHVVRKSRVPVLLVRG